MVTQTHETRFKLTASDKTRGAFKRIERSLGSVRKKLLSTQAAVLGMVGVGGFGALAIGLVKVNANMQTLKASLTTVTGSAEASAEAFDLIERFAVSTPFELDQVVQSFIKLKALGLDPSEEALKSYGNTASALGKSLDQMIEAVADAATGEFERLKEFGIKARKQGDNVTFVFQGVATTIKNNAQEIEGFLQGIGNNQFGSAMADQMGNLTPAFSNLSAAVKDMQVQIGESGVNDLIVEMTTNLTAFIKAFDKDQIEAGTKAALGGIADILEAVDSTISFFNSRDYLATAGIVGYMVYGRVGVAAILAAQLVIDGIAESMLGLQQKFAGEGLVIADPEKIEEAREKLDFLQNTYDIHHRQRLLLRQELESANEKSSRLEVEAQERLIMGMETMLMSGRKITGIKEAEKGVLANVVALIRDQISATEELNEISGSGSPTQTPAVAAVVEQTPEQIAFEESLRIKLEKLNESLKTEEQRIAESHLARQQILIDAEQAGLDSIVPFNDLKLALAKQHEDQLTAVVLKGLSERQKFQLKSGKAQTKTVLGELTNMTQGVAQHNKTMFNINKTAGIANALIGAYESFNRTMGAYPYPINIGLAGLSLAAGLAQVQAIRSTSFSGGGGGTTPSAAGGAPTVNDSPVPTLPAAAANAPSPTVVNLTIVGGLHSSEQVREIIEAINEEVGDGVQLNATVTA